jgi:ribosomal protein S18 acetylase RimI-like enzyme
MKTRMATAQDLPRVLLMVHQLAEFHGDNATLTIAELRNLIRRQSEGLKLLVAEVDGQLVGYAALCPLIQLQWGLRGIDMHHLYVIKSLRRKRIGKMLLQTSIEEAKNSGYRYLSVGTHPDNSAAQQFYASNGFRERTGGGPRFRKDF